MPAPAHSNFILDISTREKALSTSKNCLRLHGFIVAKLVVKYTELFEVDLDILAEVRLLQETKLLAVCSDSLYSLAAGAAEFAYLDSPPLDYIRQDFNEKIETSLEDGSYEIINGYWASFLQSGGEEFIPEAAPLLGADEPMPDA